MYPSTAVPLVRHRALTAALALLTVFALAVAPSVASAPRLAHAAKQRPLARVHGTWTDPVGACVAHYTSIDAANGNFTCTGTSVFTGTWVGSTTWTFTAHIDPPTGMITGTTREIFTGRARQRHGTLTLVEKVKLDASGKQVDSAHIVRGTGGLAGSTGHARFVGQSNPDGSATGTYSGRWRPGK